MTIVEGGGDILCECDLFLFKWQKIVLIGLKINLIKMCSSMKKILFLLPPLIGEEREDFNERNSSYNKRIHLVVHSFINQEKKRKEKENKHPSIHR